MSTVTIFPFTLEEGKKGTIIFMRRQRSNISSYRGVQRRRFSPLLLIGVLVPVILALVATAVFVLPKIQTHAAAAVNADCTLIVPPNPLTAQGLATPYQLVATQPANGPCNEAKAAQAAFVQAAVVDPARGNIAVYDPLVIDQGAQPAIAPLVPKLPQGAVVGIWFGFNGGNLILQGTNGSMGTGHCVNGIAGSIFGQFSYCNAPAFFLAANQAIQAGKLVPPPLGKARDGLACPTVRDFAVVDQDQSDNVTTTYLVTANGQTAQMTAANKATLQNAQTQANGSDNRLLAIFLDQALGCTPWMAPDLDDAGKLVTALPLDELQAAAHQGLPVALVPSADPMVLVNNVSNLAKINAYRVGVDQAPAQNLNAASSRIYCTNLLAIAPSRMLLDAHLTKVQPSVDPAVANSLFTFLAQRFIFSYGANGLNCAKLLNQPDPVSVKTDRNGVAIDATINGTTIFSPIDCSVNGILLVGCSGTTTINGRTCTFMMDRNAHQVKITC
jgi:hypothetical protein